MHLIVNSYYYLSLMHSLRREPKAGNTLYMFPPMERQKCEKLW